MGVFAEDGHLTVEAIGDFVDGVLEGGMKQSIEGHLHACEICRELVQTARSIGRVWENLTAETYGTAYRRYQERQQSRVVEALAQAEAQEENLELKERIRQWREQWSGRAAAVAQFFAEIPQITAEVLNLETPIPGWSHAQLQFAYTEPGGRKRGLRVRGREHSVLPKTEVSLSGNKLNVTIRGLSPNARAPFVVVIPSSEEEPQVKEALRDEKSGDFVVLLQKTVSPPLIVIM